MHQTLLLSEQDSSSIKETKSAANKDRKKSQAMPKKETIIGNDHERAERRRSITHLRRRVGSFARAQQQESEKSASELSKRRPIDWLEGERERRAGRGPSPIAWARALAAV